MCSAVCPQLLARLWGRLGGARATRQWVGMVEDTKELPCLKRQRISPTDLLGQPSCASQLCCRSCRRRRIFAMPAALVLELRSHHGEILVCDCAPMHVTDKVVRTAIRLKIWMVLVPPATTFVLQPADVGVIRHVTAAHRRPASKALYMRMSLQKSGVQSVECRV